MRLDDKKINPVEGIGVWEHFTMKDGLPDMKIECLFEDCRGVLWIGTHDRGVVRYEGDEFQSFSLRDGLAGNGVFSIIEDRDGFLWFGTNQGLSRYDGQKFETIDLGGIYSFLWGNGMDQEGRLWFGLERRPGCSAALCRWDGRKGEVLTVSECAELGGESIHKVVCDDQGKLWVGGEYLYRQSDHSTFIRIKPPSADFKDIRDLLFWQDGRLWVAAVDGIWAYKGGQWEKLYETDRYSPTALLKRSSGKCWMMTADGWLWSVDGSDFSRVCQLNTVSRVGVCQDRMERLWVGTYGMGLYCYDAARLRIFGTAQNLPANRMDCITEDAEGTLWLGTGKGLACFDGYAFSCFAAEERLNDNEITGLIVDRRNRIWIGTRNGYLFVAEKGEIKLCVMIDELKGYRIKNLANDSNGKIWFSSPHGKGFGYWADGEVGFFSPDDDGDYPSWIGALLGDRGGNLWLGSANPAHWDGLCRYNSRGFERIEAISGSSILALCETEDGCLWIGTNEGLSCYDGNRVDVFSLKDGLLCEIVTAITQARDGALWIGTEGGGVCCYDGKTLQVIQIPGDPGYNVIHAIHQDRSGNFWFCTEEGLIQYRPRRIEPDVEITGVLADDFHPVSEAIQFSTSVGRVRFCFKGKSRQEHAGYLVYRYSLQGLEEEWHQTREKQVEYPPLKPGEYLFSVQAVDRDLNYSKLAEIKVLVTEDPRVEALREVLSTEAVKGDFIGESEALKKVKRQLQEVAWTDLTVLIQGETGTGKGLAARAIYELSSRKKDSFLHVNCGNLPRDLVESNLFGHERGAFTGALARKLGKFELADGGTIFLDEIGDLPLESQTKLLHVLQERLIERVGGSTLIPVDVRVIAATNRDLVKAVREGSFRADLYYRLNVFPILIPPLRDRKTDIPLLARYFVREFAVHLHQQPPFVTQDAMELLMEYDWPGNVRELEHTLQRAVLLARETGIRREHLFLGPAVLEKEELDRVEKFQILPLEEYERQYLKRVLEYTDGVIHGKNGAALLLGMKPTTLRSRLEKLDLKGHSSRGRPV